MKHSCFILRIFAILICQIFIISVRYTMNLAIDSTLHYTRKYPLLVVKLDTIRPSSATSSHMNWWPTEQITSKSMPAPYFLYVFFFFHLISFVFFESLSLVCSFWSNENGPQNPLHLIRFYLARRTAIRRQYIMDAATFLLYYTSHTSILISWYLEPKCRVKAEANNNKRAKSAKKKTHCMDTRQNAFLRSAKNYEHRRSGFGERVAHQPSHK